MTILDIKETLLNYCRTNRHLDLPPNELSDLYRICSYFVSSSKQYEKLDKIDKNSLLALLLQVQLLTCHDIEAKTTLERLADLVNDADLVNGESQWLINWRSIYLQCQIKAKKSEEGGQEIKLRHVFYYLSTASEKLLKSVNRKVASSLGGAGDPEKLKHQEDLYVLRKRRTSLYACSMDTRKEYVQKLQELVDQRPLDYEVWCELAEVYIENGELQKAHCCYQEVLTGIPLAYNIWARLGEIFLLSGKLSAKKASSKKKMGNEVVTSLKDAVMYFSRSVELCDLYPRGWCGLYVSLTRLGSLDIKASKTSSKLLVLAKKKLNEMVEAKIVNASEIESIKWILKSIN